MSWLSRLLGESRRLGTDPELSARREASRRLQRAHPHESTCAHCEWPWSVAPPHALRISDKESCFVVCRWCYDRIRRCPEMRDVYVAYYLSAWHKHWSYGRDWILHQAAIDREWPR